MNADEYAAIDARTGLSRGAVEELLSKGWRYVEEDRRIPFWQHPSWSLRDVCK